MPPASCDVRLSSTRYVRWVPMLPRTESWSPLAQGAVLDAPVVTAIAERVGRTPGQVVTRWHIERGDIVFPKTMSPERMRENIDVFDFTLSADDMATIATLDRGPGGRTGADPDTFDYKPN